MAKNKIDIQLSFGADTNKAKTALKELSDQLTKFMVTSTVNLPLTKSLSEAQDQAAKLRAALRDAVDVDTGKFDLSKFQHSLNKAGTSLETLRDTIGKAGPEGAKTFMALADSIVAAEIPTKRVNAQLAKMAKTLKDTARWQLSSNIIHGFQGALQKAYGYAQDLNRSLNDIRIVTGYNTDYMEDFAVQANKAAKALSTTTNEYAKASLIYFQQGLNDAEVARRTETTIKMANVTGEAAEDVSSYMTAVWNNFDNGTKKLEYYADAITALGAATASSSEEIATGLQKFSAVANTVGLSYEYATAALATVTSETRESAETVGTAFKTIFARLESLSLGETLDDDTTMTKYSQALATVGVNIKDANEQLKDMDTIIDEVGTKWQSINKDQQIALAQTVAGMRQYNNFIALMDNYEGFKANVDIATNSEGTLEKQSEIYAESWEAARDRVQAAAEQIYESLLDDDFFIKLLNGLEKVLGFLDKLIDSAGGLRGILSGLSAILLSTFSQQAAKGIENMVYNMKGFVGLNRKEALTTKEKAGALVEDIAPTGEGDLPQDKAFQEGMKKKIQLQLEYAQQEEQLTLEQKIQYEYQMENIDALIQKHIELAKAREQSAQEAAQVTAETMVEEREAWLPENASKEKRDDFGKNWSKDIEAFDTDEEALREYEAFLKQAAKLPQEAFEIELKNFKEKIKHLGTSLKNDLLGNIQGRKDEGFRKKRAKELLNSGDAEKKRAENTQRLIKRRTTAKGQDLSEDEKKKIEDIAQARRKSAAVSKEEVEIEKKLNTNVQNVNKNLNERKDIKVDYATAFVKGAQAVNSFIFAFSSLSSMFDTLGDPELSGWEKFGTILTSLTMVIPMLVASWTALTSIQGFSNALTAMAIAIGGKKLAQDIAQLNIETAQGALEAKNLLMSKLKLTADQAELVVSKLKQGAKLKEAITSTLGIKTKAAETVATGTKTKADATETTGIWAKVAAYIAAQAAAWPVLTATLLIVAAIGALIGVVSLLVIAFKAVDANSPEGKLKTAEENAKAMAEALDEAKNRAEKLKAAFDGYETIRDKLSECVKGTQDWNEALADNNAQVLELIKLYPRLSSMDGAITSNQETGALEIADWAIEQARAEANQAVITATIASLNAGQEVREEEIEVEKERIAKELAKKVSIGDLDYREDTLQDILQYSNEFRGKNQNEIRNFLEGLYGDSKTAVEIDEWSKVIYENMDSMTDLIEVTDQNTKASQAETKAIASLIASQDAILSQSEQGQRAAAMISGGNVTLKSYESKAQEALAQQYTKWYNDIYGKSETLSYEQIGKKGISQGTTDKGDKLAKYLISELNKVQGTNYEYIDAKGGDNSRTFKVKGQDEPLTLGEIKNALLAAKEQELFTKAMHDNTEALEQFANSTSKADKALLELSSMRNMQNNTYEEYKALYDYAEGEVKYSVDDDILTATDVQALLDAKYGDGKDGTISGDTAKRLGYNTVEEAVQAYLDIFTITAAEWKKIDLADFKFEGELNLGDAQAIDLALDNLDLGPIEDIRDQYIDMLNKVTSRIPEDKRREALSQISKIDWRNSDSLQQLDNILDSIGVGIRTGTEEWKEFDAQMKLASRTIPDYSDLLDQFTTLQALIEEIDAGSIISKKDYDQIVAYNDAWKDFFALQANGKYIFTGSTSDMIGTLQEDAQKKLDQLNTDYNLLQQYQSLNNDNFMGVDPNTVYENPLAFVNETLLSSVLQPKPISPERQSILSQIAEQYGYDYDKMMSLEEDNEERKAFEDWLNTFLAQDLSKIKYDSEGYQAALATSREELDTLRENDQISKEIYNNRLRAVELKQKEIDKYYSEELAIQNINKQLSKRQELNQDIYGFYKISGLKEELKITLQLLEANKEGLAVAKAEAQTSKEDIQSLLNQYGIEAEYDAFGNLINKEEIENLLVYNDAASKSFSELYEDYAENNEKVNQYTEDIEKSEDSQRELFESLTEELYVYLDLTQQINNEEISLGDVISEEDYERLISYNGALKDNFILTANGYKKIKEFSQEDKVNTSRDLLNKSKALKKLEGINWQAEDFDYNILNQVGLGHLNIVAGTNYTKEQLASLITQAESGSPEAEAELQTLIKMIQGAFEIDYESLALSQFTSLEDLENAGLDSLTGYDDYHQYLQTEFDEYTKLINVLDDYETKLNTVTKSKERYMIGTGGYLNALEDEQQILGGGVKAAFRQRQMAHKDLKGVTRELDIQIERDEQGNIVNTADILEAAAKKYGPKSEQLEEVENAIDNYSEKNEALITWQERQEQSWIDNAIAVKEFNDSIRDIQFEYLDYALDNLENKAFSSAQAIALMGEKMNALNTQKADIEQSINNLAASFNVVSDGTVVGQAMALIQSDNAGAREQALSLMADYNSTMQQYEQFADETANQIGKHFKDISEQYDKMESKISNFNEVLDSYRNIVDLVGKQNIGEGANDLLTAIGEQELINAKKSLELANDEYKQLMTNRRTLEERYNKETDSNQKERLKDQLETAISLEEEAYANMNEQWANTLTVANEIYQQQVSIILEEMEKQVAGTFGTLDELLSRYDQQSEVNQRYLADYKQIYELSKLSRNLEKDIDNASTVKSKQALKELQEEITQLQESGTEMSAYDLENLQKRYDLRKAEIALEEAQEAKKTVRLSRTADGNWRYVYTQNADAVAQAEQTYEDKLYALQESGAKYLDQTSQSLIKTQQEYFQAVEEIANNEELSIEQRQQKMDELTEFYNEKMQYSASEMEKVISNNKSLYYEDWAAYSEATDYKIAKSDELATSFGQTLLGQLTGEDSINTFVDSFVSMSSQTSERLKEAGGSWSDTTESIMNSIIGEDTEFISHATTEIGNLNNALFGDDGLIAELQNEIPTDSFDTLLTSVQETCQDLNSTYNNMLEDYTRFVNAMSNIGVNITSTSYGVENGNVTIPEELPVAGATGMYTGAWGPEGKIAILHEKELVLNKADTANILQAVDLVRTIASQVDIQAMQAMQGLNLRAAATVGETSQTVQQEVTIHAEFPNATNHSEIEQAFDTLINRATQYVNQN